MEQSAFEALTLGVTVFIFVIALTAGIMLMSNVLDMVNYANEQAVVGMNGTLAQSVGEVTQRTYTGMQIVTYYREELQTLEQNKKESEYVFYVKLSGETEGTIISKFINNNQLGKYLNKEFILEYNGLVANKHQYVFVENAKQD